MFLHSKKEVRKNREREGYRKEGERERERERGLSFLRTPIPSWKLYPHDI
jgi:hypothetical protein